MGIKHHKYPWINHRIQCHDPEKKSHWGYCNKKSMCRWSWSVLPTLTILCQNGKMIATFGNLSILRRKNDKLSTFQVKKGTILFHQASLSCQHWSKEPKAIPHWTILTIEQRTYRLAQFISPKKYWRGEMSLVQNICRTYNHSGVTY